MKAKYGIFLSLMSLASVVALATVTGSCRGRLSGTYVDATGVSTYEFHTNGQARISALGAEVSAQYILDGDNVILNSPQGTLVLTIRGNRLIGPMGLDLTRKPTTVEPK